MPVTSQALYFHLGMNADDDGFIQPKLTMRKIGFTDDDLKVLLAKRFLLPFESGVVVIKHWLIHNMIRLDRYKPTRFSEEKQKLFLKENKAYTDNKDNGVALLPEWQPNGNQAAPQVRLGKDRLGKDNKIPLACEGGANEEYVVDEDSDVPQQKKTPRATTTFYRSLLSWAEGERTKYLGKPFIFTKPTSQFKAMKEMREAGINLKDVETRWLELQREKGDGFDFHTVAMTFDRKR